MTTTRSLRLAFSLLLSGVVAACASGPPPEPPQEALAGVAARVVLIAPFNIVSSLPTELEGSTRMVSDALVDHLEAHGKTVHQIAFRIGRDLWKQSMKEVRASKQKRNFDNAAKVYARKIGEQVEFDVLIVPSLFVQNAKMSSRVARWDGASQRMDLVGKRTDNKASSFMAQIGSMSVKAASLFVHVLDRNGESILTNRVGLEVIQHLKRFVKRSGGRSGTDELRVGLENDNPPIEDETMVREGVARALYPFLPQEPPSPAAAMNDASNP